MINLKNDVNWKKVFGVINSVSTLTRNQTRPLRTEIVEMAIAKYSGGKLKYVGDSADGMDFEGSDGLRYECKMQGTIFQPTTPHSAKVILKNHYSTKKHDIKKTFDKMIFIDTKKRKVGVVDFEQLSIENKSADVKCWVKDQSVVDIVADGVTADKSYDGLNMEQVIFEAIQKSMK